MSLLESIIAEKRREVERRKKELPFAVLRERLFLEVRDFQSSLRKDGISIIAEIKRMSPSGGMIREDFDPVKIGQAYEKNGADAISVLTDEKFFGGMNTYLTSVKQSVSLPVLRKEFIIDEYQIYESRSIGADAVLLIARILTSVELKRCLHTAGELGLTCLVEVHSKKELEVVLSTDTRIIGINNRNLDTLEIDLKTSLKLKSMIPEEVTTVSESGVKTREDVLMMEEAGFDAVLIGESIMRAGKVGDKLRSLRN